MNMTVKGAEVTLPDAEELFAQRLAVASDDEQALFFNELGIRLWKECGGDQETQNQLCALAKLLNSRGRQVIKDLASFVSLNEIASDPSLNTEQTSGQHRAPPPCGGETASMHGLGGGEAMSRCPL